MDGGETTELSRRPGTRPGVVALRVGAAAGALATLGALTADLLDKASAPAGRPAPAPGEAGGDDADEGRTRPRLDLVAVGDPTIYDARSDLDDCAGVRRSVGPSTGGAGLDDDLRTVSERVERLRRLEFRRPVDAHLVPRSEVGVRYVNGFLKRYSERAAARDAQILEALRLVPEGIDLRQLGARLLTQGVGGFYNPRTGRLFSGATGAELTPLDEIVLAHELDHALVDQALGLPGTLSRDPMLGDAMLAHQVLAEGDATLLMTRYAAQRLDAGDFASFMGRFHPGSVSATAIPYYLARSSEFPYYEGLLLACGAWAERGWKGVDRLYVRPPASTADVLFPDRDRRETRLPVSPPSPGRGWKAARPRSFGAFDLMVLLENAELARRGEVVPGSHVDAGRGWDGGVLHSWFRGDDATIHVGLVDAGVKTRSGRRRQLCGVLRRWLLDAFPEAASARAGLDDAGAWRTGEDLVVLRCSGAEVELAKGPSGRAVRAVVR
ncbi:MAG TPA: hypothetical protein VHN37_04320 [Actinomycetota bacterium]|nr:hypothetical protein [Actinomycetota bacterium]